MAPSGVRGGAPRREKRSATVPNHVVAAAPRHRGVWSATREVALLLGLTGGNRYAAQQLWLRKERIKAEASQSASAGSQQASQQPAGCRAKPAPARAQAVPGQKTAAQLARSERSRERLFQKHLAKVAKVRPRLQAWLRRARANLGQPMELTQPVPPTGPSAAAPPPPPALAVEAPPSATPLAALWLAVRIATRWMALLRRARLRLRYGYPLSNQFSGSRRVPQAIKDELNALAAAWCAEHRPLPSPATRRAPSTPPRSRRTAAEGASRATKRDALADSPSRAPAHPKKTRAVGGLRTGRARRRRPAAAAAARADNRHQLRRRRPRRRRQPPSPLRLRPSAPGTPLPIPSAARRSALASPAAPTGDLARR